MEENMDTRILSEESYPSQIKLRKDNNVTGSNEHSETVKLSNKPNTVIIRSSDNITHLRRCTTCLKKIDPEYYFLWEFMEFCNILCISKYQGLNFKCTYCSSFINNTLFGKFYIRTQRNAFSFFCSTPCMNKLKSAIRTCSYCQKDISSNFPISLNLGDTSMNNVSFCSTVCGDKFNDVITNSARRVPLKATCGVCKQEHPITIVLKHNGNSKYFCTKRCLVAYSFVKLQMGIEQCILCQNYFSQTVLEKYTVYYAKVALFFCSTICQNMYTLKNRKIVSCNWCQNKRHNFGMIRKFSNISFQNVYICSVNCFKLYECSTSKESTCLRNSVGESFFVEIPPTAKLTNSGIVTSQYSEDNTLLPSQNSLSLKENRCDVANNLHYPHLVECKQIISHDKKPVNQRNVATMCFIPKVNKDVTVQPKMLNKEIQTHEAKFSEIILPIPVPIYVPTPMAAFSIPIPTPVPFLLPVPVPVFVPITKQSCTSLMNDVQAIHNRVPSDPCEAELLKIADIIAEEEMSVSSHKNPVPRMNQVNNHKENTQLKNDLNINKLILNTNVTQFEASATTNVINKIGTKRLFDNLDRTETQNKKKYDNKFKPTHKMSLNYTLGINAFQQWIRSQKLATVSKICKTDILQMLSDELSTALVLFIMELKKPDGSEYAPDTIYYLCLGIQYYLIKNGRTDNIFMDKSYQQFCDSLNKIAEKFKSLYNEAAHFIVTRVEEEHLWETKQLGCHSPQVLLNTLVFFNTKYYRCLTVKQHLDISFFQILKSWKKKGKSKAMMLRFYSKKLKGSTHMYEQHENETDQSRCPVRLYEFYVSKCPESVKTSDNLFYLQPEQYCTSDSPLWYMSRSLPNDTLAKMINRVKMVKEINIALLK